MHFAALVAGALAVVAIQPAATDPLAIWRVEIERQAGSPIQIARIRHDRASGVLHLAEGTQPSALLEELLSQPAIARQVVEMFGATINVGSGPNRRILLLLNLTRIEDWDVPESSVLAHELGHAWLRAANFPASIFRPGPAGCLAIHGSDIVQHVLIREELARRGLDGRLLWPAALDRAIAAAGSQPPQQIPDPCQIYRQAAEWVDVKISLPASGWPGRSRYDEVVRDRFPGLEPVVDHLVAYVTSHELGDHKVNAAAQQLVSERLRIFADTVALPPVERVKPQQK